MEAFLKAKNVKYIMKLVLFGFFRNAIDGDVPHCPLKECEKYIYAPTLKHELEPDILTDDVINNTFSNVVNLKTYNYLDLLPTHLDYVERMQNNFGLPDFIGPKQKPHRTLSFFYNIRESLKLIDIEKLSDNEPIILARADSNINRICEETITKLLTSHDIICTGYRGSTGQKIIQPGLHPDLGSGRSVIDHVFILKKSAIECFIDLYQDLEDYLRRRWEPKNEKGRPVAPNTLPNDVLIRTIPESIFWYHFHVKGLSPIVDPTERVPKKRAVHYTIQKHKNKQQFLDDIIKQTNSMN